MLQMLQQLLYCHNSSVLLLVMIASNLLCVLRLVLCCCTTEVFRKIFSQILDNKCQTDLTTDLLYTFYRLSYFLLTGDEWFENVFSRKIFRFIILVFMAHSSPFCLAGSEGLFLFTKVDGRGETCWWDQCSPVHTSCREKHPLRVSGNLAKFPRQGVGEWAMGQCQSQVFRRLRSRD